MIQIDIDIPKTCDDCPFHIYHSNKNYVCVATPLFYPMNLANYKYGRKDFCPLKEVPQEPILDKLRAKMEEISSNMNPEDEWDYGYKAGVEDLIQFLDHDLKEPKAECEAEDGEV